VSARYAPVAVERALRAPLRGQDICLLAPEDVVIFEILSTREKDLEDAAAILRRLGDELDGAMMGMELSRWPRSSARDAKRSEASPSARKRGPRSGEAARPVRTSTAPAPSKVWRLSSQLPGEITRSCPNARVPAR
jgi:hypothetical protein